MSKFEAVERMLMYYQGFHHTCVTWYITVTGFFVAGLIAAPNSPDQGVTIAILGLSSLLAVMFFIYIFRFSTRIRLLNVYLAGGEEKIPDTWREDHKKQGLEVDASVGTAFFLSIIIIMQIAIWWLTLAL